MSDHAEIRAALEAATQGLWARWRDQDGQPHMHGLLMVGIADEVIPTGEALVNTREPDGPSPIAECYIEEDADLIANAPAWLAELLVENERLREACTEFENAYVGERGDRVAAEQEIERLQEDARSFAAALGYGDGHAEPSATLAELVDPLTEAMSSARDHDECPAACELCGERLAATRCPQCHGSGCLPNPQLTYLECDTCAGAGRIHDGCAEKSYADLAQILGRVREVAEHHAGRAYSNPAGAILRALDGDS